MLLIIAGVLSTYYVPGAKLLALHSLFYDLKASLTHINGGLACTQCPQINLSGKAHLCLDRYDTLKGKRPVENLLTYWSSDLVGGNVATCVDVQPTPVTPAHLEAAPWLPTGRVDWSVMSLKSDPRRKPCNVLYLGLENAKALEEVARGMAGSVSIGLEDSIAL